MIDANDIVGNTYNEIKVLEFDHREKGHIFYKCQCSCGKIFIEKRNQILTNRTKSCGHLRYGIKDDLTGQIFGRLKVLGLDYIKSGTAHYKCQCSCEDKNIVTVRRDALIGNKTKSCGCLSREVHSKGTHGMSKTRIYRIWHHIKGRCLNENDDNYCNYGGRGIFVCDEWKDSFENFYNDMGESYYEKANIYGEENISIDRMNNNDGYYKENCRWATKEEQQNNLRSNIVFDLFGETLTLKQAVDKYADDSLSYNAVRDRVIELNWDIKNALKTPIGPRFSGGKVDKVVICPIYFDEENTSTE